MPSAVIFGAGSIGRGFIGQVCHEAGLDLVFVEVAEAVVAGLNQAGSYRHVTVDDQGRVETLVAPVRAIRPDDAPALAQAVAEATLAATCVGARALPQVCAALAPALADRIAAGAGPLNLVIAENLHDAAPQVRRWLQAGDARLTEAVMDAQVGLVTASIGRMVPVAESGAGPLAPVAVEPYHFLPIDLAAVRGALPPIPALVADPGVPFGYWADRKLFVHNLGHAMCAFLGRMCADTFVWQAIARPPVRALVRDAMVESAAAVAAAYGQPLGPLLDHIDDLLHRFSNRALGDTIARVGRDPRRKLAQGDRVLGALALCAAHGVPSGRISLALAAGLRQLRDEEALDDQAVADFLDRQGHPFDPLLRAQYDQLATGFDPEAHTALLDRRFQSATIA